MRSKQGSDRSENACRAEVAQPFCRELVCTVTVNYAEFGKLDAEKKAVTQKKGGLGC